MYHLPNYLYYKDPRAMAMTRQSCSSNGLRSIIISCSPRVKEKARGNAGSSFCCLLASLDLQW